MDLFELVVRWLPEPVLIASQRGVIEWVNQSAASLSRARPLVPGIPLSTVVQDDEKNVREYLRLCSLTSGVTLGTLSLHNDEGATVRWRCEGSALREPQATSPRRILLRLRTVHSASERFSILNQQIEELSREVRERRRVEREYAELVVKEREARDAAERANRLKDEFLTTLSHELRTPLNAIVGWVHLMRSDVGGTHDIQQRGLETIERNVRLQSQLINDLLDLSRIVSGKLRLNMQRVELFPMLQEAHESLLPASSAKQIQIHTLFDPDGETVSGDPDRLRQIVWNLLSNAIKFTPQGGSVQMRLRRAAAHIEIVVSDNGQGISGDVLPYIFDRFRQGDSSSTRQYGGLGLGLAIVRYLVELHGGTVTAQSEGRGRGATFTVSFPVPPVERLDLFLSSPRRGLPASPPLRLDDLRILIVEDDPDSRELLVALLERSGAVVHAVASAAEGFRALEQQRPNLLISDIEMPGEDGYSFIGRLRDPARGDAQFVPAIALTAYARPEDQRRALQAGFQMHLSKPVDPSELLSLIATLVRRI